MTYLLTFRCYGTHLPGDSRGWVERTRGHHPGGLRDPCEPLEQHAKSVMSDEPYLLTNATAVIVLAAIHEVCIFRDWHLHAAHIRTNHAHCVVEGILCPNRAIADFKAYASRRLNRTEVTGKRWARGGSARGLMNQGAIQAAVRYVVEGQGVPMAVYVWYREV